jgi:hypothetical protein
VARTDASTEALRDLRRARRRNRLTGVHWIDALYRAYLTALGSGIFLLFASSRLPDDRLSVAESLDLARDAPAVLGLVFALALAIGLRSGGRGGPLVLEAPVVLHELGAPVRRFDVLRGPALKQLRFLAFAGGVVGAIVGEVASRRLPVNVAASIAAGAAAFALAGLLASGAAMVLSGRRATWMAANVLAGVVLAWSVLDIVVGTTTSPLTLLGQLAVWPIEVQPLALVGVAVAVVVPVLGVASIGGISIEAALRRAGLVSQLRFAVTLQDVRTVVLLRRQLSQERPRARPWFRLRRGGRLPAAWRRDWHGILRFPAVRLGRLALLGVVAGVSVGAVWRGMIPMVVVAGLALYVAAYDAAEPVAQEVDHPTRWESYPIEPGRLLLEHLPAAVVVMVGVCAVAVVTSLVLVPPSVVAQLGPVMLLPVAAMAAFAAAIGTAQGSADAAGLVGLGPEVLGLVLFARLVIPPILVVASLLPLLTAGADASTLRVATVSNSVTYTLFALIGAYLWLRTRKPKHL